MIEEINEEAQRIVNDFRQRIRNSKNGLLKIVGLELIPVASGALLGGVGRATGEDGIPAIPIVMDFIFNGQGYCSPRGLWTLAKYGVGAALPYVDKIFQTL